jgi:HEAT repeat protein
MMQIKEEQFAELRKQAISQIAAQGKTGDPAKDDAIVQALENAFQDKDPEVKAQAVFGMANQDVPESTQILAEAIHDQNADVRLMAVDSANANNAEGQAILQQALQDSDENVKAAAGYKLGLDYTGSGH